MLNVKKNFGLRSRGELFLAQSRVIGTLTPDTNDSLRWLCRCDCTRTKSAFEPHYGRLNLNFVNDDHRENKIKQIMKKYDKDNDSQLDKAELSIMLQARACEYLLTPRCMRVPCL